MAVKRRGERAEVAGIRADDEVVEPESSFDDSAVHDVAECGPGKQLSHAPRLAVVESLHGAPDEET